MATKVQYGIKHLMVLTVVVAIVAATVGPFVRPWDAKRQMFFAIYIAGALLVFAGYIYWLYRSRVRAERNAGEVILRIRTSHGPLARGILIGAIGSLVVLMLAWTIHKIQFGVDRHGFAVFAVDLVMSSVWPAVMITPLVAWLWWGQGTRSIEVCERGFILGGNRFLSYSKLKEYRWERYGAKRLILFRYWGWDVRLNIPTEMRDEVGRLLDENGVPHKERGFW